MRPFSGPAPRSHPVSPGAGVQGYYDLKKKVWKQTGRIKSATGNIQPVPLELRENFLVAYIRRGGNFEPTTNGWILRA